MLRTARPWRLSNTPDIELQYHQNGRLPETLEIRFQRLLREPVSARPKVMQNAAGIDRRRCR